MVAAALTLVVAGLAIVGADEAWIAGGILVASGILGLGAIVGGVRGDRAAKSVLEQR